uniref:Legume lectin domain-containing protein n=1 Tax=Lactuca sativa TaxID=4236 RepID=A0A9R1XKW8_LACSA|nr:hypothetical protein LSAT_V11C300140460 [Lactuca sativa]
MCKYISILFSLCYVISTAEYTTTNGGSFTNTFDIQEMINFHHHRIKVIASKNPNPNQCSQPPPLGLNAIIGSLFDVGVKFISTSTSSMVLDSRHPWTDYETLDPKNVAVTRTLLPSPPSEETGVAQIQISDLLKVRQKQNFQYGTTSNSESKPFATKERTENGECLWIY